jgi:hypothetical protein
MPFPIAAVIGALATLTSSKMAADQANVSNAQANSRAALGQGGGGDFKPFTKYTESLRMLNDDPSSLAKVEGHKRPSLFASPEDAAATRARTESPLKAGQTQYSAEDIKGEGLAGNVYESAPGGEGGGEGFNMDNALQYAALAAQLGSMFAPPPPPPPPRAGGGGGGFNAQPFTLRMLGGR